MNGEYISYLDIIVENMNQETPNVIDPEFNLNYQLLKLSKQNKQRVLMGKVDISLDKCNGLELIHPDSHFKSFLPKLVHNCEFLMVVTMYNESIEQFNNTFDGIKNNVKDFTSQGISCDKLAVVVVADGIAPFSKSLENKSNQKGFAEYYDRRLIQESICERLDLPKSDAETIDEINGLKIKTQGDEIAHCFMRKVKIEQNSENYLQVIFCVKQLNLRKLNSHLWFFGGFCKMIKPRFVMLIDVGTKPLKHSLYYLYEALNNNSKLAGVCGEIRPMKPSKCNFIKMAQAVEYMYAHVFDKALESAIGFISVLPGAFSAYRWRALDGPPLWKYYFKSIKHPEHMDCYDLNMYLAEDRVLSLALLSQPGTQYFLRYVKKSVSETDVPGDLSKILAQRRRWINGSWFALIEVISNFYKLSKSKHSCCQKFLFRMQLIYMITNVLLSWISVGTFFLGFAILISKNGKVESDDEDLLDIGTWIMIFYLTMLVMIFILSLATRANLVVKVFNVLSGLIGIYMWGAMYMLVQYFANPEVYQDNFWVIAIVCYSIVIYIITPLLHNPVYNMKILTLGFICFITLIPTYVNVFQIYSICNIQDVTWGNRPDKPTEDEKKKQQEFDEYRCKWVIIWVVCNSLFAFFFRNVQKETGVEWYMWTIAIIGLILTTIRFVGALIYLMKECCFYSNTKDLHDENEENQILNEKDKLNLEDTYHESEEDEQIQPRTFREHRVVTRPITNTKEKKVVVLDGKEFRYELIPEAQADYIQYFTELELQNLTERPQNLEEEEKLQIEHSKKQIQPIRNYLSPNGVQIPSIRVQKPPKEEQILSIRVQKPPIGAQIPSIKGDLLSKEDRLSSIEDQLPSSSGRALSLSDSDEKEISSSECKPIIQQRRGFDPSWIENRA